VTFKIEKILSNTTPSLDSNSLCFAKTNKGDINCYIADEEGNITYLLNGKIDYIPTVLRDLSGTNLNEDTASIIHSDEICFFEITNYCSFIEYVITPISGNITISDEYITYTAPTTIQPAGFIINGIKFELTMVPLAGEQLDTFCLLNNQLANFTDGLGGSNAIPLVINSLDCGYIESPLTGILVNDTFTNSSIELIENHKGEIGADWITAADDSNHGSSFALKVLNGKLILDETNLSVYDKFYSISPSGGNVSGLTNLTIEFGLYINPSIGNLLESNILIYFQKSINDSLESPLSIPVLKTRYYNNTVSGNGLSFDINSNANTFTLNSGNSIQTDVVYNIKLVLNNNTASLYVDDVLLGTTNNSQILLPVNNRILTINFLNSGFDNQSAPSNHLTYFKLYTTSNVSMQTGYRKLTILDKFLGSALPASDENIGNLFKHTMDTKHTWVYGDANKKLQIVGDGTCSPIDPSYSTRCNAFCFQEMTESDYWIELDTYMYSNVQDYADLSYVSIIFKGYQRPHLVHGLLNSNYSEVIFRHDDPNMLISYNQYSDFQLITNLPVNNSLSVPISFMSRNTFRVEVIGINLYVYINKNLIDSRIIDSSIELRKGWIGFGTNVISFPNGEYNPAVRAIDIREFRAGVFV
jgi:hypothetical protein